MTTSVRFLRHFVNPHGFFRLCYNLGMNASSKPWYKRPMIVIFIMLAILIAFWTVWFVSQVVRNVSLIRSGQPTSIEQNQRRRLEASVSSQMANTQVSQADLNRMEVGPYPAFGNPKAPLHVVEFVDFECPYSRQVAPVLRDVMRAHAQDAYFVIRDFPIAEIHPDAERSALAAGCVFALGGREPYWTYFDRLFTTQGSHGDDQLRALALQVGIDGSKFDRCISDQVNTQRIQRALQDGLNVGVDGTPTFFINGYKIQGAMDAATFDIALEQARQKTVQP